MVPRGPFALEVPGHTYRFELHDYGGPIVLGKHGKPLADQPGARSLFWEAYWQWERQGRRVDDQGRCLFKWETALVHITTQAGHALLVVPTTPPAQPELPAAPPTQAAKVTIRSIPQDAEIFVDAKFVGNAPAVLTLPVGKHQFRALLKGYAEWNKELELTPNSEFTLLAKLVKPAKSAAKL
jgi:hypothetical protein